MSDRLTFAKFSMEDDPDVAKVYSIQSMPLIIFKNGIEVERQSGAMTESSLVAYLLKFVR